MKTARIHHAARWRGGAWPLVARAQQPAKLPTIGFLGTAADSAESPRIVHSCSGCANSAGSRVAPSRSSIAGRKDAASAIAEIAAEFVRLKVDVIVASEPRSPRSQAGDIGHSHRLRDRRGPGRQRLGRIPLATGRQRHRPVGPVDRSCRQAPRTVARGLPGAAPIGDHGQWRHSQPVLEMGEVQAAAHTLGLEIVTSLSVARRISRQRSTRSRAGRMHCMSCGDLLMITNRLRINTLALGARLPTIYGTGSTSKPAV